MSEVASLEISKQLYEISGWKDTHFSWRSQYKQEARIVDIQPNIESDTPAYDLGYIMRKLPTQISNHPLHLSYNIYSLYWDIRYHIADSGEYITTNVQLTDCVALLAIKLFKNGIINSET